MESWYQKILNKLYLVLIKFIKKYSILYTICKGGSETDSAESDIQWKKVSRKLIKHTTVLGLITITP